jgi:hypothetical protein
MGISVRATNIYIKTKMFHVKLFGEIGSRRKHTLLRRGAIRRVDLCKWNIVIAFILGPCFSVLLGSDRGPTMVWWWFKSDRSVQAERISRSVVVTGDGNTVSLRFGDSGVILPLKRKQFQPPERRRAFLLDERPRELDLLIPEAGKLPLVDREDLRAELRAWLADEARISVHAIIGRAGTGNGGQMPDAPWHHPIGAVAGRHSWR